MSNLSLRAGQRGPFTSAVGKWVSLIAMAAASLRACVFPLKLKIKASNLVSFAPLWEKPYCSFPGKLQHWIFMAGVGFSWFLPWHEVPASALGTLHFLQ